MSYFAHTVVVLVACLQLLHFGDSKRSSDIYCGACIGMVDEVNWEIDHVDQKSTIQVGSFRIDSRGNQGLREIPFARSEVHLSELLDSICSHMTNYAETEGDSGRKIYIRTSSRDGHGISLPNLKISSDISGQLKFACESLIEEYEEELLEAFRTSQSNIMEYSCIELMDVCKPNNITDFSVATSEALRAAIQTEADRNAATENEKSQVEDDETDDDADESPELLDTKQDL